MIWYLVLKNARMPGEDTSNAKGHILHAKA